MPVVSSLLGRGETKSLAQVPQVEGDRTCDCHRRSVIKVEVGDAGKVGHHAMGHRVVLVWRLKCAPSAWLPVYPFLF